MNMLVLIDVENLCYRHAHALPRTTYPHPGVYGVMSSLERLKQTMYLMCGGEITFCFCFDADDEYLRRQELPSYKVGRNVSEIRGFMKAEMGTLRRNILPEIGYQNVLHFPGLEADDIIALVAKHNKGRKIIVSNDHDLYQLVDEEVWYWNVANKVRVGEEYIRDRHYGIGPSLWVEYKAMTGCRTDNIPGIPGVGVKTAAKIVLGTAKVREAEKIVGHQEVIERNQRLVQLPYHKITLVPSKFKAVRDSPCPAAWDRWARKCDMKSLIGKCPR